jgi:hypothetical protein
MLTLGGLGLSPSCPVLTRALLSPSPLSQMRRWCLAQQAEKEARLAAEKDADREYAAYLESLGKMRDDLELTRRSERELAAAQLKAENDRMVRCATVSACPCGGRCALLCLPRATVAGCSLGLLCEVCVLPYVYLSIASRRVCRIISLVSCALASRASSRFKRAPMPRPVRRCRRLELLTTRF